MRSDTASNVRRSRFMVGVGAAAVAAILLAGCSGPGSTIHASRESDPRPAPTTPSTSPGSGQERDTTEGQDDEGRSQERRRDERRRDERGGPGRGQPAAFCDMLRTPEDQAPEGPDELLAWMDELVSVAPPQIRDDVEVWRDVADTLTSLDEGDPENLARMLETLTDPRTRRAAEKIGKFAERECGLELDDAFGDLDPFPGD